MLWNVFGVKKRKESRDREPQTDICTDLWWMYRGGMDGG